MKSMGLIFWLSAKVQKKMVIVLKDKKLKPLVWKRELTWNAYLIIKYTLNFWVKVKSGWADDERALRSLGYMDE